MKKTARFLRKCQIFFVNLAHRTPHTAHRTPHTAHRTPHTAHRTPHTHNLTYLFSALFVRFFFSVYFFLFPLFLFAQQKQEISSDFYVAPQTVLVGKERVFVNKNHNTNFVAQSLIQLNNDTAQILFQPIFVTENTVFYGSENLQNSVVFVPNLKTETRFLAQIQISPKQRFEEKINKKEPQNRETKTAQTQIYPSDNNPQNNAHYFWRNAIVTTSSTNYPKFFDKTHSNQNTNCPKNWAENETKNSLSFAHQSPKELHPSINIYKNRPPPLSS